MHSSKFYLVLALVLSYFLLLTACSKATMKPKEFAEKCCEDDAEVDCIGDLCLTLPNVFTPNNDGINDIFYIHSLAGNQSYTAGVSIFDPAGNIVYENSEMRFNDPSSAWDGSNSNGEIIQNLYQVELQYTGPNDETHYLSNKVAVLLEMDCVENWSNCEFSSQFNGVKGFDPSVSTLEESRSCN